MDVRIGRGGLALVVAVRLELTASCPAVVVTTPPATPVAAPGQPAYTGYYYEVFLIDAATGGDALVYDETEPAPCGGTGVIPASVAVPIEETSMPWMLDRRNPDRYSAVLTAYVPPCDFHDSLVDVIPGTGLVRVLAYGTVAAQCGQPRPVTVYLQAASVTQNLPPCARPTRQRGARGVRRVPRVAAGPGDADQPRPDLARARDRAGPALIPAISHAAGN